MAAERQHMFASSAAGVTLGNLDIYTVTLWTKKNLLTFSRSWGK